MPKRKGTSRTASASKARAAAGSQGPRPDDADHYMPGRLRLEDISDVVTTAQPFDVAGFGTVCIVRTDH